MAGATNATARLSARFPLAPLVSASTTLVLLLTAAFGFGFGVPDSAIPPEIGPALMLIGGSGTLLVLGAGLLALRSFYRRAWPAEGKDAKGRNSRSLAPLAKRHSLKQARAALRQSNEMLSAVLSSINECYYTVDRQWRITHVNANAAAFWGELPDRLVGRTLWDVAPRLDGGELEIPLRKALDEQIPMHLEGRSMLRPARWLEIHCYPWADGLSIFFRDITRRRSAEEAACGTQQLLQQTINALSAHVAILDEQGAIIAVNAAWRRFANEHGFGGAPYCVGCSYLSVCEAAIVRSADAKQAVIGLRAVLSGEQSEFHLPYRSSTSAGTRWFQMRATRFDLGGARRVVIAHEDVTDIKEAETGLRELAGRLLHVQDEERRRMARELHDTTAQNLVAAMLHIDCLRQIAPPLEDSAQAEIADIRLLLDQSLQEIRTLSYLLHPPLLDQLGLASALRWYARGFESRSGISVSLTVPEDMDRLSAAVESALFRVVQEALTNIHRHSGSATAAIQLTQSAEETVLEISDKGKGMRPNAASDSACDLTYLGVGISGMRVRLHQLGGELQIRSMGQGTTIRAVVSRQDAQSLADPDDLAKQVPAALVWSATAGAGLCREVM